MPQAWLALTGCVSPSSFLLRTQVAVTVPRPLLPNSVIFLSPLSSRSPSVPYFTVAPGDRTRAPVLYIPVNVLLLVVASPLVLDDQRPTEISNPD